MELVEVKYGFHDFVNIRRNTGYLSSFLIFLMKNYKGKEVEKRGNGEDIGRNEDSR